MVKVTRKQDGKKASYMFFNTKEEAIEGIKKNMEEIHLLSQKQCGWVDRETQEEDNLYTLTLSPMLMFYKPMIFTYAISGKDI